MEYWAIINNEQVGPMTPAEIARRGLTPDTMVWRTGMSQWEKARYVADFAPYLPPSFAPGGNSYYGRDDDETRPPMPQNYLIWSVLSFLFCCQVTGLVALIYSLLVEYRYSHHDYEGAENASSVAKNWNIASIVLVVLWIPILFACGVFSSLFSFL